MLLSNAAASAICRVDDKPPPPAWDAIAGVYKTGDGRYVRLHTNFPHHRDNVCKVLACKPERDDVQRALMQWKAEQFETAAYAGGCVVSMMRSHDEWLAHPQAKALEQLPLLTIEKIGEAAPKPWPAGDRPLAGLRVLDLSRVIAGPVAGRTWAAHGADVMLISSPNLPSIPWLVIDTGRGKLTSFVDLKTEQGRDMLRGLHGGGRHLLAGLSSAIDRCARLFARGCSTNEPRHYLRVTVSLWPCWPLGRGGEVSIPWCRRRLASTMPRARRLVLKGQRSCRCRSSIMRPAISWRSEQ